MALASFPGSGNTWLLHLLAQTTGIYTVSLYDQELNLTLNKHVDKHIVDDSVIAIKTHWHGHSVLFRKAILMIRDLFSAMIGEWNRLHAGPVKHADQSTFIQNNGSAWAKYVYQYINEWAYFNIH